MTPGNLSPIIPLFHDFSIPFLLSTIIPSFHHSIVPLPPVWSLIWTLAVFVFGACIGSFLNVCVYRIPREISVNRPRRSFCPRCQHVIAWYDNIPLLSILLLRGRCRRCGGRISLRYFVVEALVAALFALVWLQYCSPGGPPILGMTSIEDWRLIPIYWLAVAGLTLGTFVDFDFLIIPDRVTLGGIALGLILSAAAPALHRAGIWYQGLLRALLGASVGWGALWLVAQVGRLIFRRDAMGFGDVKLLGAIGAFLGWRAVLFVIMLSSLLGSVVGITLIAAGQKQLRSRIPYGPYLALAAVVWMLWGQGIWRLYLEFVFPPMPLP
ncbi:MAG: A24 family peptidase [Verrucomicrobiota bacterium]|nr:A24 family peptidase [Verrucomicrobiota bacterium]